jgi:hypothetical protein
LEIAFLPPVVQTEDRKENCNFVDEGNFHHQTLVGLEEQTKQEGEKREKYHFLMTKRKC